MIWRVCYQVLALIQTLLLRYRYVSMLFIINISVDLLCKLRLSCPNDLSVRYRPNNQPVARYSRCVFNSNTIQPFTLASPAVNITVPIASSSSSSSSSVRFCALILFKKVKKRSGTEFSSRMDFEGISCLMVYSHLTWLCINSNNTQPVVAVNITPVNVLLRALEDVISSAGG